MSSSDLPTPADQQLAEPTESHHQLRRKAGQVIDIADRLAEEELTRARTEALIFARSIALAALPKRPTKSKSLVRDLRLGKELWLRVSYQTEQNADLPYGEDRFVLAAIQHLAISNNSPVVYFDRVGALLKLFGVAEGGNAIRLLRQRFKRLSALAITLTFAASEEQLDQENDREKILVIRRHALPSKKDFQAAAAGQQRLPMLPPDQEGNQRSFGVELSLDFWELLQDQQDHLIVPVELLKLFIDCPTGWDYLCFLVARCGRARSSTVIDHEILMGLFKEGKESDRNTMARLRKYHDLIMTATRGNLKASLEEIGYFPKPKGQRGRRKKRWGLKVHPSQPIVFSGKKQLPFPAMLDSKE